MITLGIDIGGSSVKTAALDGDKILGTAQSPTYSRPTTAQLIDSIKKSLPAASPQILEHIRKAGAPGLKIERLGLCLPGIYDSASRKITQSINVPGLVGPTLDDLITQSLGQNLPQSDIKIFTDAFAAAHDILTLKKLAGRFLVISIGTAIAPAVPDKGQPPNVAAPSPAPLAHP